MQERQYKISISVIVSLIHQYPLYLSIYTQLYCFLQWAHNTTTHTHTWDKPTRVGMRGGEGSLRTPALEVIKCVHNGSALGKECLAWERLDYIVKQIKGMKDTRITCIQRSEQCVSCTGVGGYSSTWLIIEVSPASA